MTVTVLWAGGSAVLKIVFCTRSTRSTVRITRLPSHFRNIMWFFPELNEPAHPAAAARSVSHDACGQAAGGSAVRTE